MIRNIVGSLFLVLSGLIVLTICFLAFMELPGAPNKVVMTIMMVYGVLFLILHVIGLALLKGPPWKRVTAITLISGGALSAFTVFMVAVLNTVPMVKAMDGAESLASFNVYGRGVFVVAVIVMLAVVLFVLDARQTRAKIAN